MSQEPRVCQQRPRGRYLVENVLHTIGRSLLRDLVNPIVEIGVIAFAFSRNYDAGCFVGNQTQLVRTQQVPNMKKSIQSEMAHLSPSKRVPSVGVVGRHGRYSISGSFEGVVGQVAQNAVRQLIIHFWRTAS